MFSAALPGLLTGKKLSRSQAALLFDTCFTGKVTPQQIKNLLVLLARRGETAEDLLGCLDAVRKNEPQIKERITGLLDTCGTGGDGSRSINISTLAALAAAGAGCKVAKHGNRAFSSKCGSSDLLEALGVKLDAASGKMIRAAKAGFGYFHAPYYHPAVAGMHPVRKQIGIKTIFNLLGPLANPMKLESKLAGVSSLENFKMFTEILKKAGVKRVLLVYCVGDSLDEISCSVPTHAALITGGKVKKFTIDPKKLGFKPVPKSRLSVASLEESKRKALKVLQGKEKGPILDVILINAGAAIWIAGKAKNLAEGIEKARQSVRSGRAYQSLKKLVEISNS